MGVDLFNLLSLLEGSDQSKQQNKNWEFEPLVLLYIVRFPNIVASHSSLVGGGIAPKAGFPAFIKPQKKTCDRGSTVPLIL